MQSQISNNLDNNYILSPIEDGEDIVCSQFKVNLKSNKQIIKFNDEYGNECWIQSLMDGGVDTFRTSKDNKCINWDSVFTDVDIKEEIDGNKVKEYITVKNDKAKKDFKFLLTVSNNLEYKQVGESVVFIHKESGAQVASIDKPVVKDNKGLDVNYNYRLDGSDLYLETKEDLSKFTFPIVIDPSYTITTDTGATGTPNAIIRQSNGNLFMVKQQTSGALQSIYYYKSTDRGQSWSGATMITAPSGFSQYSPQIAVDSNDNLHVVFYGKTSSLSSQDQIRYVSATSNEAWGTVENLTYLNAESGYAQQNPRVVIDSNNIVNIAWLGKTSASGTTNHVRYVSGNSNAWSDIEEISRNINALSGYDQGATNINIDGNDIQHIVWTGRSSDFISVYNIFHVSGTKDARCSINTVTNGNSYNQYNPCIVLDSSNNVHCTWRGTTSASNSKDCLKYLKYNYSTLTWGDSYYIFETSSYNQSDSCPMVDRYDNLHITWRGYTSAFGTNYQIKYIKYSNSTSSWGNFIDITSTNSQNTYLNRLNSFNPYIDNERTNIPISGYGIAFLSAATKFVFYTSNDYTFGDEPTGQYMTPNSKYW